MQVQLRRGKLIEVSSYAEASARVNEAIGNTRASAFNFGQIYENGTQIAHVSYNGKVWSGEPRAWSSKTPLLYTPVD